MGIASHSKEPLYVTASTLPTSQTRKSAAPVAPGDALRSLLCEGPFFECATRPDRDVQEGEKHLRTNRETRPNQKLAYSDFVM